MSVLTDLRKDEKFNALSPEAQKIVLTKKDPSFASLSDEAKNIVVTTKQTPIPEDTSIKAKLPGLLSTAAQTVAKTIPGVGTVVDIASHPKEVGAAMSAPLRGYRGVGVGTQRLIEGDSAGQALERASAATKIGYTPKAGEKIGAFTGTALPMAPLGLLPGAAVAGIDAASEKLAQSESVRSASATGGATAGTVLATAGILHYPLKVTGAGFKIVGEGLSAAYRNLVGSIKGVGRNVVDQVFDAAQESTPTVLKAAEGFYDKISGLQKKTGRNVAKAETRKITGATEQEVIDSAVNLTKTLRKSAYDLVEKGKSELSTEQTIDPQKIANTINTFKEKLQLKGTAVGNESKRAIARLNSWLSDLNKITKGTPGTAPTPTGMVDVSGKMIMKPEIPEGPPTKLTELEFKKYIELLGKDTNWEGPADDATKKTLRPLYRELRSTLGKRPSFAKAHRLLDTADNIQEAFSLKSEANNVVSATDSTYSHVRGMIEGKRPVSAEITKKSGLGNILKSATGRKAQEEGKKLTVEKAKEAAKINYIKPGPLWDIAESAARGGVGGPQHYDLEQALKPILGEKDAKKLAYDLVTSAAKEIFLRKKGSGLPGQSLTRFVGAELGEAAISKLKFADKILRSPKLPGIMLQQVDKYLPKRGLAGLAYGNEKNNAR